MQAGPRRLRPIIMTTLATMGGMLPLALGIEAGSATQAPLGTVVVGGLLTSTMLSLLVVPTLYLATDNFFTGLRRKRKTEVSPDFPEDPAMTERPPVGAARADYTPVR